MRHHSILFFFTLLSRDIISIFFPEKTLMSTFTGLRFPGILNKPVHPPSGAGFMELIITFPILKSSPIYPGASLMDASAPFSSVICTVMMTPLSVFHVPNRGSFLPARRGAVQPAVRKTRKPITETPNSALLEWIIRSRRIIKVT